jgi:hypothetical protein
MAKDPVPNLPPSTEERERRIGRPAGSYPVKDWMLLYQNGLSTPKIAKLYGFGTSTVWRYLDQHISLRDRVEAVVSASTKYPKIPFSGDETEGAFLAGLVEDFHVRKAGRLIELGSATTHPAMGRLFHQIFGLYGHPTSSPSYDPRGYYRYHLSVSLHSSFEPFLTKSERIPSWIPRSRHNPVFESYVSGLIAAEGCIRLYDNHGRADAVLHITLKKPALLSELSQVLGGRLYEVQRAWRLVIYGKAAVEILRRTSALHEEKVEKTKLVLEHTGEKWSHVGHLWQELVNYFHGEVSRYKAGARSAYVQRHNAPHPAEIMGRGRY